MKRYKKNYGDFGETIAAEFLSRKGYKILERQYRAAHGEIDIIALSPSGTAIVFVEVKTRHTKEYGDAAMSVNKKKIAVMVRTAAHYILENPTDSELRFDVIEVYGEPENAEINHYENAIPDVSDYIDI